MGSNSELRARIERLPSWPRRALTAILGPALDRPDDAKAGPLIAVMAKQLYLSPPVHAVLFAAIGVKLIGHFPVSSACEPKIAGLAQMSLLVLYELLAVPALMLLTAILVRKRFRDPYAAHAARASLILMILTFAGIACSAAASFMKQDARLRRFGVEVLHCAYDGTPPSER